MSKIAYGHALVVKGSANGRKAVIRCSLGRVSVQTSRRDFDLSLDAWRSL